MCGRDFPNGSVPFVGALTMDAVTAATCRLILFSFFLIFFDVGSERRRRRRSPPTYAQQLLFFRELRVGDVARIRDVRK